MKRSEIKRKTPLRANPETTRAWQDRSRRNSTLSSRSSLGRSKPMKRGKSIRARNPARAASEFARCFHSKARVAFVKSLPCCVCGQGPTVNAHVTIGGTGYRSGYDQIAPLCMLCHAEQEARSAAFERDHHLPEGFLLAAAAATERAWHDYSNRCP